MSFQVENKSRQQESKSQADIRYLIVGATPGSGWERLLPLLEQAGCSMPAAEALKQWKTAMREHTVTAPSDATTTILNPALKSGGEALLEACNLPALIPPGDIEEASMLEYWLHEFTGTYLLLLHTRPEPVLVQAMANGQDPIEALKEWRYAAEQLLRIYRHNRHRASMIDCDDALEAPEDFLNSCVENLGLASIPTAFSHMGNSPGRQVCGEEIERLIAAQMVFQSPEIGALINELEACSLPMGDSAAQSAIDCSRLYNTYRSERTQLRKESHLEQKIKHLQDERQQIEHRLNEFDQENELLILQLHQVQEELENYYNQLQSAQEKSRKSDIKIKNIESKFKEQQRKLEYIRSSWSWKITAPIRILIRSIRSNKKKDNRAK